MSLSALLLCSSAIIKCMCSSGGRPRGEIAFRVSCGDAGDAEDCQFRVIQCPWMASPSALVEIEDRPPSFTSFMAEELADLKTALEVCGEYRFFANEASLVAIIGQVDGALAKIRETFWSLLFSREGRASTHPPTPNEIDELCLMCQDVLEKIRSAVPIPGPAIQSIFEPHIARFVLPTVVCCSSDRPYGKVIECRAVSQQEVAVYMANLELAELTAHINPVAPLFRTFHPGLLIQYDIQFTNAARERSFKTSLLLKDLSLEVKRDFDMMVDPDEPDPFAFMNALRPFRFYSRATAKNRPAEWELVSDISPPLRNGPNGETYLSLIQTRVELRHAISKTTGQKTVQYHPKKPESEAPAPSGAHLPPEILVLIFEHCLSLDQVTEIYKTCMWARRQFPPCLVPSSKKRVLKSFRGIMIPSSSLAQFLLASLITVASRPTSYGRRSDAVRKLCLFVESHFPLLEKNLLVALDEYISGRKSLPSHLMPHSDCLLKSKVLQDMVSFLALQKPQTVPRDSRGQIIRDMQ